MELRDAGKFKESWLESHRECCGWRPPGERCGAESRSSVCTRPPGHADKHYDAFTSTSFTPGAVADWAKVLEWRRANDP